MRTASGPSEGIAEASRALPDLIILDVEMPEMDGLSACAALKADAATSNVPVIILTATQDTKLNERAFKVGACATVVKGGSADSLINVVRLALATGSIGRGSAA